jgi:hypothetical protein
MPPLGATQFATDEAGGLRRDPSRIFSHRMPGAQDQDLLQDALDLQVHTAFENGMLRVTVSLYNDNTGHKIPTDSPLRQMLLIIEVLDQAGAPITLLDGPTLPEWAGIGEPAEGYYAARPGKAYALIWNPTRVIEDSRLEPFEEDFSSYLFQVTEGEPVQIHVRVLFRRAFIELMDQKGWSDPDILMAEETLTVLPQ